MEEKKVYDNKYLTHSMRLDLSKMVDVDIIKIDGKDGIFIPFAPNDIRKRDKGLYALFKIFEQRPNPAGYTHYIRQSIKGSRDTNWVGSLIPKKFIFVNEKREEKDKFNF